MRISSVRLCRWAIPGQEAENRGESQLLQAAFLCRVSLLQVGLEEVFFFKAAGKMSFTVEGTCAIVTYKCNPDVKKTGRWKEEGWMFSSTGSQSWCDHWGNSSSFSVAKKSGDLWHGLRFLSICFPNKIPDGPPKVVLDPVQKRTPTALREFPSIAV